MSGDVACGVVLGGVDEGEQRWEGTLYASPTTREPGAERNLL